MYPQSNITRQNIQNMTLEESMRVYEDLLHENLQLKQQMQRAKNPKYFSHTTIPSPSTAFKTTHLQSPLYLQSQQIYSSPLFPTTDYQYYQKNMEYDMRKQNEHYLEQLIEKNRYLEEKIDRLGRIHGKQHHDIQQIRRSRQWEERFDCREDTCYQEKYMQLLRVRSPFY